MPNFLVLLAILFPMAALAGEPLLFMTGVDSSYSQGMAAAGMTWKVSGTAADLFASLHAAGADSFRVRVWTVASGSGSTLSAVAMAKQAQGAGMKPYPVFFLSDNWSDYVDQYVPAAWTNLSFTQKLAAVAEYSEQTARAFKQAGITPVVYEIGNEIDFGICGEFEQDWGNRFNIDYMNSQIWPKEARIIRAAEKGIHRVNPKARFILHLTQWWNPDYVVAFYQAMIANGATVDFLGLSFYPTSGLAPQQTFSDLDASVETINQDTGLSVIICETGYPAVPSFSGQFSTWNVPVPGYPLTNDGQQQWLADALAYCRGQSKIRGFFYWSPEWYSDLWTAFALFDPDGNARPALNSLR